MKAILRIPTKQQYAFVEIEAEVKDSKEAMQKYYQALKDLKDAEENSLREEAAEIKEPFPSGAAKGLSKSLIWPNQEKYVEKPAKTYKLKK